MKLSELQQVAEKFLLGLKNVNFKLSRLIVAQNFQPAPLKSKNLQTLAR